MAIDFRQEKHISLEEARSLPWLSKVYTFQTLVAWATVGLKGRGGQTVVLETTREGRRLVTSEEAVHRFFERLDEDKPSERTPTQAARAHDRAAAMLGSLGFKSVKPAAPAAPAAV